MSQDQLPSSQVTPVTPVTPVMPIEERRTIRFHGEGLMLFLTLLVNALLSVVTLGVYYFWGKAKLRRYVWESLELDGQRFAFHGTGKEMFIGWLKVAGIFLGGGLVLGGATAVFGPQSAAAMMLMLMFYMGIFVIVPFAIVGARRYLLSRTTFRGIRFSFNGEGAELLGPFLKGSVLSAITIGFYSPYFTSDLYGYLINHSTYGDRPFKYEGDGKALMNGYVRAFFLGFVTFGLAWVWYAAERTRYLRAHTTWGGIRFHSTVTGGSLLALHFVNALLVIFTLGIGAPWAMARLIRFECENLHLRGSLDLAGVQQSHDQGSAVGEELASHLDIGAGFGA